MCSQTSWYRHVSNMDSFLCTIGELYQLQTSSTITSRAYMYQANLAITVLQNLTVLVDSPANCSPLKIYSPSEIFTMVCWGQMLVMCPPYRVVKQRTGINFWVMSEIHVGYGYHTLWSDFKNMFRLSRNVPLNSSPHTLDRTRAKHFFVWHQLTQIISILSRVEFHFVASIENVFEWCTHWINIGRESGLERRE